MQQYEAYIAPNSFSIYTSASYKDTPENIRPTHSCNWKNTLLKQQK